MQLEPSHLDGEGLHWPRMIDQLCLTHLNTTINTPLGLLGDSHHEPIPDTWINHHIHMYLIFLLWGHFLALICIICLQGTEKSRVVMMPIFVVIGDHWRQSWHHDNSRVLVSYEHGLHFVGRVVTTLTHVFEVISPVLGQSHSEIFMTQSGSCSDRYNTC